MPKLSIIVPVYNAEKYLKKCINSILSQSFLDIEIIIINDGSTDGSENIILEFNKKNSEIIKYYKKENSGLSNTRNYGVEKAAGDYLCFLDADDYLNETLFENLLNYMNKNIDLIKYKLIKVNEKYEEIEKISGPVFEIKNGQEAFNKLFYIDKYLEPSCLYLYNTKFFKEKKFKFAEKLYHEDFGLTPIIMLQARTVASVDFYGYYYMQSNNSITRNNNYEKDKKRAYDLLIHYDNMIEKIKNIKLDKITEKNIKQYYSNAILNATKRIKENEKNKYIFEIKKRNLINNIQVKNLKQLIKKLLLKIDIKLYNKIK